MSPDCLPTSPSEALPPRLRARHPDTTLLGNGRRALMRVNDGYRGRLPDLGAYEYGEAIPHYGPRKSR